MLKVKRKNALASMGARMHVRRGHALRAMRKSAGLYLMIAIPVAYLLLFHYQPIYGVLIAFQDYNPVKGVMGSPWVGLQHLMRFFRSFYFGQILNNTIILSAYGIVVGLPFPIILALMFNEIRLRTLRGFYQTLSYAPSFLSVVVVVGMFLFFFNPTTGFINTIIENLGFERINFMGQREYFRHIYVWTGIWQGAGWGTVLYTATLSSVSPELYEAAVIDGANRFQRILHISIPSLVPTIVIITILSVGGILGVGFEKVYLLQNGMNTDVSEVISTYVYKTGVLGGGFSFSAAVGIFNSLVNLIILIAVNTLARRMSDASLW